MRPSEGVAPGLERVSASLRWLARLPILRTVRRARWAERLADAFYYGRLVEETVRFVVRELRQSGRVCAYRPRGARLDVLIRHDTSDRYILAEIFQLGQYDFPAAAVESLEELGGAPLVVDLGAHVGLFGVHVLDRFPDARLVAYEVDPANAVVLAECIARNRLNDRWRIVQASAAPSYGVDHFAGGLLAASHVDADGELSVPRRDVFPDLAEADVVKIDIEGSEWPILDDPRFAALKATIVALEYHPHRCPYPDPRIAALELFARLGYRVEEVDVPSAPSGVGMLWAWRDRTRRPTPASAASRSKSAYACSTSAFR